MINFWFIFMPVVAFCILVLVIAYTVSSSSEEGKSDWYKLSMKIILVGAISAVISTYILVNPWSGIKGDTAESRAALLGQMGDFFGGMLNPILAFASFIALLYTIRIQSKQIREAKEGQELAAFDSTFSMIIQALSETPKPARERFTYMNPFNSGGLDSPERLSKEYATHYRNNEPSIIVFSCMFYDCVKFLSEHRCTKSVHWNILANMLGPIECYYVASLCAYSSANTMDLDSFSKLATKNELFRQARVVYGLVSIGHGDSSIDGRWPYLNPNKLGLELDSFRRAH